jgi:hypothetical protein
MTMSYSHLHVLAAALAGSLLLTVPAAAQAPGTPPGPAPGAPGPTPPGVPVPLDVSPSGTACREGRAANGSCANAQIGLAARDRAIIFSQPRLSMMSPPRVAPSSPRANDRFFRAPNNPVTDADKELDVLLRR